jgi:hypothetical protein
MTAYFYCEGEEMKCPKCGFDQGCEKECIRCGIVFDKYLNKQRTSSGAPAPQNRSSTVSPAADEVATEEGVDLGELFFYVDPDAGNFSLIWRGLLLLILFFWGLKFIFSSIDSNYAGESFLHLVNLPFHEAGHILFRIMGRFMMVLGGSLNQLLIPLICLSVFLFKTRDTFGASVSLWWLGENLIDLAPYINDARDLRLVLLGGVTGRDVDDFHDWEFILRNLGLLKYDHLLAKISHLAGALLMTCAVFWGSFVLFKQLRIRRS